MPVDLHLHSIYSDGTDSPAEIVDLAVAAGLRTIALTDHDNLDGIAAIREAAEGHELDVIAGTELSVDWGSDAMHMLVYFLEPVEGPLQGRLAGIQQSRSDRNRRVADVLADLGMDVPYDEVVAEAKGKGVGRPHFAAIMVRKKYVASFAEAFDRYLGKGRPAYQDRVRLGAVETIQLARASGAVPAIAHPHTLGVGAEDYREAFGQLTDAGLGGIEAHYAEYAPELREHLASLCADLGIAATGGSDYHGSYKEGLHVGVGFGDLVVPDKAVEDLLLQQNAS